MKSPTGRSLLALGCLSSLVTAPGVASQQALQTTLGESNGDSFAIFVRSAGDVDKDGVSDFIVGAPGNDGNGTDSGSASVYSGVDGVVIHVFRGADAKTKFGYSVDGAGDVNGDGFADVIVGAPFEDFHGADVYPNVGSAQVFSGRDGDLLHTFRGDTEGEALGWSVCGVGDVDRDGRDDLAVAAPFYDHKKDPDVGRVVVYSGRTGDKLYDIRGETAGDRFGWSLCSVGDLDSDKVGEIVVGIEGSRWQDKQVGSARIFSGRKGRKIRTLRTGEEEDYFGSSVANAGDVDGDGRDDIVIGAWNALGPNEQRTGVALVYSGRSPKILLRLAGSSVHDRFGAAVAGIGDVDGDGHGDIAVGAPQEADKGSGYVRVFSGAGGRILFTMIGEAIGDGFGTSISTAADRDEDGIPEVLVGAPGMGSRGG